MTPGGYDRSCWAVVESQIVVGIILVGIVIVVVVVEVVVVEVVEVVDVSGMKSVSIFIFSCMLSSELNRPRGSIIKVPESRVSSKKSSAKPT